MRRQGGRHRAVAHCYVGLCGRWPVYRRICCSRSGALPFGRHGTRIGYEYRAISAVLVGGTAIQGGEGSVVRTLAGTFFIALMQGLLILCVASGSRCNTC